MNNFSISNPANPLNPLNPISPLNANSPIYNTKTETTVGTPTTHDSNEAIHVGGIVAVALMIFVVIYVIFYAIKNN